MAPYLVAFSPAEPGKPHPAPWKPVKGDLSFDVYAQLYIPKDLRIERWFDRINTIWWFLALIRLNGYTFARVPVVGILPFSEIPNSINEPIFWPVEMNSERLNPSESAIIQLDLSVLEWVNKYWLTAGMLMRDYESFSIAFQAVDQCIWNNSPALALVNVWGGLEKIFSPSNQELRFRISTAIAAYLEPPGENRLNLFYTIRKLYDARSRAAHGTASDEKKAFTDTYNLLRRVLIKIIEENKVPQKEEIEKLIFGV